MKQTIRLTESDLHKIVKESVNKILNEISLDTIGSADSQAQEKYNNYRRKYGENDPRTQKVKKQQQMFSGKFSDEYAKGNLSKRARMLSNQEKRMKGERTYVNGKGWRNDVNEGVLKEGGIHSDNIPSALLRDIEENFGNNSITQMDSSWYVVGVLGKYGSYEIDVPANGHCRIKLYRTNKHGKSEDDQWYYYSTEWFEMCEENNTSKITESRMLTEGEEWIGAFNQHNFDDLRNKVNGCKGNCSFSLNGKDFTIIPTQRGFTITSGVDFKYDALNADNALKAAWRFSNYY